MKNMSLLKPEWRRINFEAMNLNGFAKILLNPVDEGFSKEFGLYGFREPLNTLAIFKMVSKTNPTILDIGGNLGYFPLIELQAGAKEVVVLEPQPSTFALLSQTLGDFTNVELLNEAINDIPEPLKLYFTNKLNITSSSPELITAINRNDKLRKIDAKSVTLKEISDEYATTMVRMDIEGHEYRVLSKIMPDLIQTICVELHVLPPYNKTKAVKLLQMLKEQDFEVIIAINEMDYGYYPLIQHLGMDAAYKIATSANARIKSCPSVQVDPTWDKLIDHIPQEGQIHLILHR